MESGGNKEDNNRRDDKPQSLDHAKAKKDTENELKEQNLREMQGVAEFDEACMSVYSLPWLLEEESLLIEASDDLEDYEGNNAAMPTTAKLGKNDAYSQTSSEEDLLKITANDIDKHYSKGMLQRESVLPQEDPDDESLGLTELMEKGARLGSEDVSGTEEAAGGDSPTTQEAIEHFWEQILVFEGLALNTSHPATAAPPPLIFPKDDEKISSALNIQSTSTAINTRTEEFPPYHFPKLKTDAKLPPFIFPKPKFNAKALDEKKEKQKLNSTILNGKKNFSPKVAVEVTDLLKGGENATVYEDKTETAMENDILTVEGPHVKDPGTTHEEEGASHRVSNVTSGSPNIGENVTFIVTEAIFNISEAAVTNDMLDNVTSAPYVVNSTTIEGTLNLTTSTEANETEFTNEKNGSKEKTADDNRTQKQTAETKIEILKSTPKTYTENYTSMTPESTSEDSSDEDHEKPMAMASQQHSEHLHPAPGKASPFLQPTESAAILAGVFVAIALLGYVGLLIWRRILEKRYGNREMLVNEEDFYDTNDLKNFEL